MSEWRPIKTAPHDETVLVAGGDAMYPVTACWSGLSCECWWVDGQGEVHIEIGWPTHWMPLPKPPRTLDVDDLEHLEGMLEDRERG